MNFKTYIVKAFKEKQAAENRNQTS